MIKNISKKEINTIAGSGTCWIRCQTYLGHAEELTNNDHVQNYRYIVSNNGECQKKLEDVKRFFHAYCAVMQWPGN